MQSGQFLDPGVARGAPRCSGARRRLRRVEGPDLDISVRHPVPVVLEQDVARITSFYHNYGYIDAKVGEPEVTQKEKGLYITFNISNNFFLWI